MGAIQKVVINSFMDLCSPLKTLKKTVNYGRIDMNHYVKYAKNTFRNKEVILCLTHSLP